jgi:tetraacyldisaccharide 4'-kinase
VGNISVGGNGKTPMVIWLCDYLSSIDKKVVVISRGYGGTSEHYPLAIEANSSPYMCGDEPVLIFQRTGCNVVVGPDRAANIKQAIAQFSPDIIVSDDGLQHYKMQRDIELCIVDSKRQFGNGFLMPAGPLRETKKRLNSIDLIIENGGDAQLNYQLNSAGLYRVIDNSKVSLTTADSSGIAVSAIGNPQRFEQSLSSAGVVIKQSAHFRDHHKYTEDDFLQFNNTNIFMTEKDAVKCRQFAKQNWYYLKVDAVLNTYTKQQLTQKLMACFNQ